MSGLRGMRRWVVLVAAVVAGGLLTVVPARAAGTTVTVDGASPGRVFDGIGALSAGASSRLLVDYPEPARSQVLDYLFKPGYGAALQILKVEIGGDTNSTDGTEPSHARTGTDLDCGRGYEWWLMEQAKQRNPNIVLNALAWGAPGWVGAGKQTVWTDQFLSYLLSWLGCADRHGLRIDYLGGWNEKGADAAWYVKLKAALAAHGYGSIKVVADDSFNWTVVDTLGSNSAFRDAVDVVGQHYVCGYLSAYTDCPSPDTARALGKPLWASEQGSQPYDTGAAPLARAYNRQYVDGRMTGTINWSLEWSAYAGLPFPGDGLLLANEPWSGHYLIGPSVWATAQTTQFTRPGWRYLDSGSQRIPGGSIVTLRDPTGPAWTSIAETLNTTTPQQVSYTVTGGLSTTPVHVWATNLSSNNPNDWFVHQPDITPTGGAFTATLQPGYVYTFTTTPADQAGRGTATSPPAQSWQLPYQDSFEDYPADTTPRYSSDLGGTFATAPCQGGRTGQCLRQVVSQQPVQWNHTDNYPVTVLGDPLHWRNYQVSVDALLERDGAVELGGRTVNGVSGYHLHVTAAGAWKLTKVAADGTATTLASGTTSFGVGQWHRLALTLQEGQVSAGMDGATLATVADRTYAAGQVSLAVSAWQQAEFDNLDIDGIASHAGMTATADSTQSGYEPAKAIDGNPATMWHSQWSPYQPLPHTLTLDLGRTATVDGLLHQPRTDGNHNGIITGYTVSTSTDGVTYQQAATGRWPLDTLLHAARFTARPARYVQLQAAAGGGDFASAAEVDVLGAGQGSDVLPHAGMTAAADSAQPGYEPAKAIDDNPITMWHSQWSPNQPLPHALTLDLGRTATVNGVLYQPRADGNHNGIITGYTVSTSTDGVTYQQAATGQWPLDPLPHTAQFTPRQARYVRLQATAGGGDFASAAEVDVLGVPGPAS